MKIMRKISVGAINGVRGGFTDVKEKFRALTIVGIAAGYKEKTSETMGVSYGFHGEFRGINRHGEEAMAAVAYLPEPAQGLLKAQIDGIGEGARVEFGFELWVVPSSTAIKGYEFETHPLMESRPSNALESLAKQLNVAIGVDKPPRQLALTDESEQEQIHDERASATRKPVAKKAKKR